MYFLYKELFAMILTEKCKEKKAKKGLKISQIAQLTDLPLSTVNTFFADTVKNPSLMTAVAICKVVGQSLDSIYGIEDEDMSMQELERIRAEHKQHEDELNRRLEEHAHNILLHEINIKNCQEIIARQDSQIAELHDRIDYQKKAIRMHRIAIIAITACAAVLAVLAFV